MSYRPNFNDPRARKRIIQAVEWAETTLSGDEPRTVSSHTLNKQFGALGGKKETLSDWLRPKLLIRSGQYAEGQCFSYKLNLIGVQALRTLLKAEGIIPAHPLVVYARDFASELQSGVFSYNDTTNDCRRHHKLHSVRRVDKQKFWSKEGYNFDYDLSASGPTILSQMAIGADIPVIRDYLVNKKELRAGLAARIGVTVQEAKQVITALFNGARVVAHGKCAIFVKLKGDKEALQKLKNDEWVQSLLADVKVMWVTIRDLHFQKTGEKLKKSQLWSLYYGQERAVMDAALEYVKTGSKVFIEHDGFRTDTQQDVSLMQAAVYQKTGFHVVFDEDIYTKEEITHTDFTTGCSMMIQVSETGFENPDAPSVRHIVEARRSGFDATTLR